MWILRVGDYAHICIHGAGCAGEAERVTGLPCADEVCEPGLGVGARLQQEGK